MRSSSPLLRFVCHLGVWVVAWLLLSASSGCAPLCTRNSECAAGLTCGAEGSCIVPPADTSDAGDGGAPQG